MKSSQSEIEDFEAVKKQMSDLGLKIENRSGSKKAVERHQSDFDFKDQIPIGKRKRLRKQRNLTVSDKISIVHKVYCQLYKQEDVAKEYRVTQSCFNRIVTRAA